MVGGDGVDPPEGLAEFCRREHPRLVGALGSYVGSVMVGEELAQETLIRVASRWRRVAGMRSPSGFAHRVGMNLATSHLRRRAAERRARARMAHEAVAVHRDEDAAAVVAVREALARLAEGQRQALVLRYAGGLSVAETAAALGVSEPAVRSRCARGLEGLRRRLGEQAPVGEGGWQ